MVNYIHSFLKIGEIGGGGEPRVSEERNLWFLKDLSLSIRHWNVLSLHDRQYKIRVSLTGV